MQNRMRTIKQKNSTMRGDSGKQVRWCSQVVYKQIENEKYKEEHGCSAIARVAVKTKHKSRWCPGYCKICGEYMEVVTHLHAAEHGYKSAEEFIKAGNVIFE